MILAAPRCLLADLFVTLILPSRSSHLAEARRMTTRITGSNSRTILVAHPGEVILESKPGVIRLTITA
jgi:hypothetical protein